jgi:hypothetical protein
MGDHPPFLGGMGDYCSIPPGENRQTVSHWVFCDPDLARHLGDHTKTIPYQASYLPPFWNGLLLGAPGVNACSLSSFFYLPPILHQFSQLGNGHSFTLLLCIHNVAAGHSFQGRRLRGENAVMFIGSRGWTFLYCFNRCGRP